MLASLHNDHPMADWTVAGTLTAGAFAWHMDLVQMNQVIAAAGGLLGVAYMAARLYFLLREKLRDGRSNLDKPR